MAANSSTPDGTAVVGVLGEFESFNPVTSTHITSDQVGKFMLFTPLIRYDKNLQPRPWLAERWELTDTSVTFTLRDDVMWHDGQPVTAEDVKFTFDMAKKQETASLLASAFLNQVKSATVRDSRTIHFTFEAPHAQALDGFYWAPLPKHLLADVPAGQLAQAPYNQQPVGSGPFTFESWEKGQRLTLVANSNFPQGLGGPPELKRVVFRVFGEPTTMITELMKGSADVTGYTLLPEQAQQIRPALLENLAGLGTGNLRELYDGIIAMQGRFYLSGGSSKARGVTEQDLVGKPAEFAGPPQLVRLSLEHDRKFTY